MRPFDRQPEPDPLERFGLHDRDNPEEQDYLADLVPGASDERFGEFTPQGEGWVRCSCGAWVSPDRPEPVCVLCGESLEEAA